MKSFVIIITCTLCFFSAKAQQWKLYYDSAGVAEKNRHFQQAQMYYAHAEENLPKDSANTITAISICKGAGETSLRLGDYRTARRYLEQARQISLNIHYTNMPLYATICERLGRVYEHTAPEMAESSYLKAAEIIMQLYSDSTLEYAAVCNSLGNYYYNNAQYGKSVAMHLSAKKIRANLLGVSHAEYARSCNNLGAVYLAMGEYEKAEAHVQEAKNIRSALPPENAHPDYAISCINLANIYRDLGQYEKAEHLYITARNIRAGIAPARLHPDYASSCNILADLYAQTGKTADAENLYKEALLIREKTGGRKSLAYAESCNNLAALYSRMKRYSEAETLALDAKNIWDASAPADNPNHAINRNNIGELYFKMDDLKKSLIYFTEAGKIWKEQLGEQHPYYTGNLYSLARLFKQLRLTETADSLFKKAMTAQNDQATRIFRFTSENEKFAFLEKSKTLRDEYLSFCIHQPAKADAGFLYNHILSTKGIILSSLRQIRQQVYSSNDTAMINRYEIWLDKKKQLAALYSTLSANSEKINQLEESCNAIEKWLARQSAAFSKAKLQPDWHQVKNKLGEKEAAVEFVSFRYFNGKEWTDSILYAALVIRKHLPSPLLIPLFEKKQLDSIIGESNQLAMVNKIYTRGVKGIKVVRNTRPLYDVIWKPLEEHLEKAEKVFYSPAGQLYRVAFAALANREGKLISDYVQLMQCNSTEYAGSSNITITPKDQIFLFGGIQYDAVSLLNKSFYNLPGDSNQMRTPYFKARQLYPFLPGTLTEVIQIRKQAKQFAIPVTVVSGSNATEQCFKNISSIKRPAVLHIATHGFYNNTSTDTPLLQAVKQSPLMKSGLLFAGAQHSINGARLKGNEDGIATALEISAIHLPATRLVVLSACETALGDLQGDEGVYGLQRAFRLAGVQYLLMSLWEVPDAETAIFMTVFYRFLFLKKSIPEAFLRTQTMMKNRYRNQPVKWAAWILVN